MDILSYAMAKNSTSGAIEEAIASLPKGIIYKGAVNYENNLPNNPSVGDAYTVLYRGTSGEEVNGQEYVWGKYNNVNQWIVLGPDMSQYQEKLVSGTNIKTVNGNSVLGSGNVTIHNIPSGGTTGQVLTKDSATDYDVSWANVPAGTEVIKYTFANNTYTCTHTYAQITSILSNNIPYIALLDSSPRISELTLYNVNDYCILWLYGIAMASGGVLRRTLLMHVNNNLINLQTSDSASIIPSGGTQGQVLTKSSSTDYDTTWVDVSGTSVTSVNNKTGAVVLTASDVGADPAGSSSTVASTLAQHVGDTNMHTTVAEKAGWDAKYSKPSDGIPKTDLASDVQSSLNDAMGALHSPVSYHDLDSEVQMKLEQGVPSGGQYGNVLWINYNGEPDWYSPVVTGISPDLEGPGLFINYSDGNSNHISIESGNIFSQIMNSPVTGYGELFSTLFTMAKTSPGTKVGLKGCTIMGVEVYQRSFQIVSGIGLVPIISMYINDQDGAVVFMGKNFDIEARTREFGGRLIGSFYYEGNFYDDIYQYQITIQFHYNGEIFVSCVAFNNYTALPNQDTPINETEEDIRVGVGNISYTDLKASANRSADFDISGTNTTYTGDWTSSDYFNVRYQGVLYNYGIIWDDQEEKFDIDFRGFSLD